jgi:hypothetical protein
MLPGPKSVAEPHKELRFTRSGQGRRLFLAAAALSTLSIFLLAAAFTPGLEFPLWWSLLPLLPAVGLFYLAYRCVRFAYLLLTPLGVEIFPLTKARQNLQVLYWSEIAHAEIDPQQSFLTLHFNEEQTSGIKASLRPIAKAQRPLLARAIEGRMAERLDRRPD